MAWKAVPPYAFLRAFGSKKGSAEATDDDHWQASREYSHDIEDIRYRRPGVKSEAERSHPT